MRHDVVNDDFVAVRIGCRGLDDERINDASARKDKQKLAVITHFFVHILQCSMFVKVDDCERCLLPVASVGNSCFSSLSIV